MREIKNILFRRILYKIPLKFLLILFAIVAVFIASFSDAGLVVSNTEHRVGLCNQCNYRDNSADILCIENLTCSWLVYSLNDRTNSPLSADIDGMGVCTQDHVIYYTVNSNQGNSSSCSYDFVSYQIQEYTSLQCQSEYSLIPVSSVDSNYCQTNNLCPSSDCPVCPEGGSGFSNVYINDIFHPSAFNIVINIPEEIDWDYAYTANGNNLNIDVVGYNVDYDYINGQYDIQNFKPNSEDLSNIVSSILPLFIPGLVIILFLYFLFKFIKKIF